MEKSKIFILLFLLFIHSGCERVIEMDLNESQPALVIEGDLSYPDGQLNVTISRTGSYFDADPMQKVSGADVYLENKNGHQEWVPEVANGYYLLDNIHIEPGDLFKLKVEVDDMVYSAESSVQIPVEIDSIGYSYYAGDDFFRPGYRFNLAFYDPAGEKNYYRVRVYRNGHLFNRPTDLVVFDDSDLDGTLINVRLHSQYYLEKGETAVMELMSIDRNSWEYFKSLSEVINVAPGSPAPANPVSNFSNGAMGYFYTWSYNRKPVVIRD